MSTLENFVFDDWAGEHSLDRDSTRVLRQQHLDKADQLMSLERSHVMRLGLSLGQELALVTALVALGNTTVKQTDASSSQPTTDTSAEAGTSKQTEDTDKEEGATAADKDRNLTALDNAEDALDGLMSAMGVVAPARMMVKKDNSIPPSSRTEFQDPHDPRILLTIKASSRRAEKIINFLPDRVKERVQRRKRDRLVFSQGEDGSITFKPAEEDMHSITMAEWGAANMRLLSHLLRSGQLDYPEVEYYLAYTMQVYELADKFEWAGIMEFDSRYRELQAEHGFRWGDMRFASQIHLLTPRRQVIQPNQRKPAGPKEDCKRWLASGGKNCLFGSKCKYMHRKVPSEESPKNEA